MGFTASTLGLSLSENRDRQYPTFSYWLEKTRNNDVNSRPGGANWRRARKIDIASGWYPKEAIDPDWRPEESLSRRDIVYLEGRSPSGTTDKSARRKVPALRGDRRGLGLATRKRGNVILGAQEKLG